MITHHARLVVKCKHHEDHVVHLISRDDFCEIVAATAALRCRADGYQSEVLVWQEGDHGGMPEPRALNVEALDEDEIPF